jgi:hypothetical protein
MIECVFTLDYEIYGNGCGSLADLVYQPTAQLKAVFDRHDSKFVLFVEATELEMIERHGTDSASGKVRRQIREYHQQGFEIGLHVHPWWYNARRDGDAWVLDYGEYSLAGLSEERMICIVDSAIEYLRDVLDKPEFTPLSFRAGHLLFQPAKTLARLLATRGVQIDSSVYSGGLWRRYQLDYRPALRNGPYWRFSESVTTPDPGGVLLEIPISTRMVPPWTMLTSKRVGLERRGSSAKQTSQKYLSRFADFARVRHPRKLDFCHMTLEELKDVVDRVVADDQFNPATLHPIVAIGHSKELVEVETVDSFLNYLRQLGISVSTFEDVYSRWPRLRQAA